MNRNGSRLSRVVGFWAIAVFACTVAATPGHCVQYVNSSPARYVWTPASGSVDHYNVYVSTNGGPFVLQGETSTESFAVSVTDTNRFVVQVEAEDGVGQVGTKSDASEDVVAFLNGSSGDTDGDGLPNDYETQHGLDPYNPADAVLDLDGDGLNNTQEYSAGTNPALEDTDGDGLNDGEEKAFWGVAWNEDADNDGVINLLDSDSDGDGYSDGEEALQGTDPGDPGSVPGLPKMEIGEVVVNHEWQRVSFTESFVDPIVAAKPASFQDSDPGVVRIRNVDATGFEIRFQEWDYLDDLHQMETIGYIVLERGSYELADGTRIEAGRLTASQKGTAFKSVTFAKAFNTKPVLFASIITENEADAVASRVRSIATTGFQVRMEEQELNSRSHVAETIGYIAWEPSSGMLGSIKFEVRISTSVASSTWRWMTFASGFAGVPYLIADMQTTNGGDTTALRYQMKDAYRVQVLAEEEQSKNSETNHMAESLGYMAFSDS